MLTTPIKLPIIVRTMTVASIFRIPYAVLAFHKLFVLTACNTRINTDRLYDNDPILLELSDLSTHDSFGTQMTAINCVLAKRNPCESVTHWNGIMLLLVTQDGAKPGLMT